MANTYYDSELTAEEIEMALEAIDGVIIPANNGKVLAINNGKLEARSVQWGGGGGYPEPTGKIQITENQIDINVKDYALADVAVPNSYVAADEGKVVSGGMLVAQTERASEITVNGIYDTTDNNSVTVNVSGSATIQDKSTSQNGVILPDSGYNGLGSVTVDVTGNAGTPGIYSGLDEPTGNIGSNGDYYYKRKRYFTNVAEKSSFTGVRTASNSRSGGWDFTTGSSVAEIIGISVNPDSANVTAYISDTSGNTIATVTTNNASVKSWNDLLFENPIILQANTTYTVWYTQNSGNIRYGNNMNVLSPFQFVRRRDSSSYNTFPTSNTTADFLVTPMVGFPYLVVDKQYLKSSGAWEQIA